MDVLQTGRISSLVYLKRSLERRRSSFVEVSLGIGTASCPMPSRPSPPPPRPQPRIEMAASQSGSFSVQLPARQTRRVRSFLLTGLTQVLLLSKLKGSWLRCRGVQCHRNRGPSADATRSTVFGVAFCNVVWLVGVGLEHCKRLCSINLI